MRRWEVYLADVPFEEQADSKVRPVLLLGACAAVIDCLKMTGQSPRPGEYVLQKWEEAGLRKPTTVRISKRLALPENRLRRRLGMLQPVDIMEIERLLTQ